ncbi:hypothetical protein SLEP1_g21502 [Rubroshorea leprosula]|uniref:SHSP domain-containing protein n=1 Tax=Rubroshorea leprosula TaxID=152421 RepID=A0AAV5J652_9ROSI|nr:hypothetical protein SLEP1_g21502 [Rubroshorea leprosula]
MSNIVRSGFFSGVSGPYMTSYVWDPFSGMECVGPANILYHPTMPAGMRFDPRIEWKDTPEAHVFKINLPGFRKNDLQVKVEGNMLCIIGEKHVEKQENTYMGYRMERSSGMFSKSFELPLDVRADKIKTCFENEVLTVTAPKDAKRSERFIEIH